MASNQYDPSGAACPVEQCGVYRLGLVAALKTQEITITKKDNKI
jgi:hypothetical protein